ncbi:AraC family transcriptional regulator [Neobacillus sp. LXY-1]|uniref:AraC family transcriptional regulator n=1 Tax=Neobacillus sp. LXY-1 TaxID=3379133 RepID=UPI003EDF24E8
MSAKLEEQKLELASLISRYTDKDGFHQTSLKSMKLIRFSTISEPLHSIYEPSVCFIAQGSKLVMLANEMYQYDPNRYLVASVHLPITGKITEATRDNPFLCLQLSFSTEQILDILKDMPIVKQEKDLSPKALVVGKATSPLLDAVIRLIKLLDDPSEMNVLAPLVIREILFRILRNEHGEQVKQFAILGNKASSIEKVIKLINRDFAKTLRVDELAQSINMSTSSLHVYFKKVTGMSPLQYQKMIRLQMARQFLLSDHVHAAEIAFQVGYESPSQFNREYARLFGSPPISDRNKIKALTSKE